MSVILDGRPVAAVAFEDVEALRPGNRQSDHRRRIVGLFANTFALIVDRNLAELSDTEQTVLRRRFNWQETQEQPLTLEEVGQIIGVTKERVRQIQNKALEKIRVELETGFLSTTPRSSEDDQEGEPSPDGQVELTNARELVLN